MNTPCKPYLPTLPVSLTEFGDRVLDKLPGGAPEWLPSTEPAPAIVELMRRGLDFRRNESVEPPGPHPHIVMVGAATEVEPATLTAKVETARESVRNSEQQGIVGVILATDRLGARTECEAVSASLLDMGVAYVLLADRTDSAGRCLVTEEDHAELLRLIFNYVNLSPLSSAIQARLGSADSGHSAPEERCFSLGLRRMPVSASALQRTAGAILKRELAGRLFAGGRTPVGGPAAGQRASDFVASVWTGSAELNMTAEAAAAMLMALEQDLQRLRLNAATQATVAGIEGLGRGRRRRSFWIRLIGAIRAAMLRRRLTSLGFEEDREKIGITIARLEAEQLELGTALESIAALRAGLRDGEGPGDSALLAQLPVSVEELVRACGIDAIPDLARITSNLLPWKDLSGGEPAHELVRRLSAYCQSCYAGLDASRVSVELLKKRLDDFTQGIGVWWPRLGPTRRYHLALVPDGIPLDLAGTQIVQAPNVDEIVFVELASNIRVQQEENLHANNGTANDTEA